jgi:Outer membrane protein
MRSRADEQQSEALFRSVQLSLQADVAQNYFQLRELDTDQDLYRRTVALREDTLKLVERRFKEGDIGELDVSRLATNWRVRVRMPWAWRASARLLSTALRFCSASRRRISRSRKRRLCR